MTTLLQSPVVFDEEHHIYTINGMRLSGITSLIHAVLHLGEYPDASDFVRNVAIPRAGEYGTTVHNAIRLWDEIGIRDTHRDGHYGVWDVDAELDSYIASRDGFTPLANEYTVSDETMYASQIDNVWIKNDTQGIWLADTKTNNLAYYPGGEDGLKEYLSWQLSCYAYLFERQTGKKVEGLIGNWFRRGESRQWQIERKADEDVRLLLSVVWTIDMETDGFIYHDDGVAELIMLPPVPAETKTQLLPENVVNTIYSMLMQAKEAEEMVKGFKAQLRTAMENAGIKSWDSGKFKATISADSMQTKFDTTRFKQEHPDLYEQYTSKTERKGSFTVALK